VCGVYTRAKRAVEDEFGCGSDGAVGVLHRAAVLVVQRHRRGVERHERVRDGVPICGLEVSVG
jgi:hypothetical protein